MNVLFVYSLDDIRPVARPLRSWSSMQYGISYISALLKSHGHRTSLLVLGSAYPQAGRERLGAALSEFQPGLILFTAVFSQYAFIAGMAAFAKEIRPESYLVIGGVHATLQPEEALAGPFDAVCVGEGEYPILELCGELSAGKRPAGIPNLWFTSPGGEVEKNPPRPFLQELDRLPFPDHAIWEPWIRERAGDEMVILGGRGCPYDCSYCSNHALRKTAPGHYVRMRSPENILAEVRHLYAHYPHRLFFFEIETLDCYREWTFELCRQLEQFNASLPEPVTFGSNYRINPRTIDEELFAALKRANFGLINLGLESGSERLRRDVLTRHYTNDDFLWVVSLARRHGLKVFVFNMIGLPGESYADHRETVRLNRLVQPDGHFTGIFFPYPGTALHELCRQQRLIPENSSAYLERRQPAITLPQFSAARIRRAYRWFDYRVYHGYQPLWKILARVALVTISSRPGRLFLYQRADRLREAAVSCLKGLWRGKTVADEKI